MQENVVQFEPAIIDGILGHLYSCDSVVLDPHEFGWPIARRRRYTILRHRGKSGPAAAPLNMMSKLFLTDHLLETRDGEPAWDMFFIAGCSELRGELLWAASRPQTSWSGSISPESLDPRDAATFMNTLTDTEQKYLSEYRALPNAAGQIYQLNQNPSAVATMSSDSKMVTIIKNAGVLWSPDSIAMSQSQVCVRVRQSCSCVLLCRRMWRCRAKSVEHMQLMCSCAMYVDMKSTKSVYEYMTNVPRKSAVQSGATRTDDGLPHGKRFFSKASQSGPT